MPFQKGNKLAVGHGPPRKPESPEDVVCPLALVARGMGGLWLDQVKLAKKGNQQALTKVWELLEKYGGDPKKADSDAVDHRYDGFPDEVADLLRELDMGIADVVHRYELGFCCEDIEILIAETAIAVREGGARCAAVQRWRRVAIEAVCKLKEQKGSDDEQKSGKQGQGEAGASDGRGAAPGATGGDTTTDDRADRGGRSSSSAPDSTTGAGDGRAG